MRFYFDIDDERFEDEFGLEFQREVKESAIYSIADEVFSHATGDSLHSECSKAVRKILDDNKQAIIDRIVDKVANDIARKKAILEITPKASQLVEANKENIAYFEAMIDKAIAKRFGK